MESKYISIKKAAKTLGVSEDTLRRWDREGKLAASRTEGGHRRYDISALRPETVHKANPFEVRKTIAYARVSSHDQKADLIRQQQVLELFCAKNGWTYEIISDLGSGMNYNKKGLTKLLNLILSGDIGRLVLTHKDRLLRFGAELVFSICEIKDVEVAFINKGSEASFEEELSADVLEIVNMFSLRLYGLQSKKNKKIVDGLSKIVNEVTNNDPGPQDKT